MATRIASGGCALYRRALGSRSAGAIQLPPFMPTCGWPKSRCGRVTAPTRSSTIARPVSSWRLQPRRKRKGRRWTDGRRRDLEGDHLVQREHDLLGVAVVQLRSLSVTGIDVDDELLAGLDGERRHVLDVERLGRPLPRAPDLEKIAQREDALRRRFDVDHVLVGGVDVQPVVAGRSRDRAHDADVGGDVDLIAEIDDLHGGVVMDLRVLELVAWDPGRRRRLAVGTADDAIHDDAYEQSGENSADRDRKHQDVAPRPDLRRQASTRFVVLDASLGPLGSGGGGDR